MKSSETVACEYEHSKLQFAFKWRMEFLNKKLSEEDRAMEKHAIQALKGNKKSFRKLVGMLQYRGLIDYGN